MLFGIRPEIGKTKNADGILSAFRQWMEAQPEKPVRHVDVLVDNTVSQNKNQSILGGMQRFVAMGLVESINLHFKVAGHTKNMCDQMFSTVKGIAYGVDLFTFDDFFDLPKYPAWLKIIDLKVVHDYRATLPTTAFPNISSLHYFRITRTGVSGKATPSADWGPEISMLQAGKAWPSDAQLNVIPAAILGEPYQRSMPKWLKFIPADKHLGSHGYAGRRQETPT